MLESYNPLPLPHLPLTRHLSGTEMGKPWTFGNAEESSVEEGKQADPKGQIPRPGPSLPCTTMLSFLSPQ